MADPPCTHASGAQVVTIPIAARCFSTNPALVRAHRDRVWFMPLASGSALPPAVGIPGGLMTAHPFALAVRPFAAPRAKRTRTSPEGPCNPAYHQARERARSVPTGQKRFSLNRR